MKIECTTKANKNSVEKCFAQLKNGTIFEMMDAPGILLMKINEFKSDTSQENCIADVNCLVLNGNFSYVPATTTVLPYEDAEIVIH